MITYPIKNMEMLFMAGIQAPFALCAWVLVPGLRIGHAPPWGPKDLG
jgi:hypothetical protein